MLSKNYASGGLHGEKDELASEAASRRFDVSQQKTKKQKRSAKATRGKIKALWDASGRAC